jgi:hypothetical protein
MKKIYLLPLALLTSISLYAQTISTDNMKGKTELVNKSLEDEKEDIAYEMKHKSASWFKKMNQPHSNYFEVKKEFDRYFGSHLWEKSKPRQLAESWIKSKIFYLDKNGIVQNEPPFDFLAMRQNMTHTPPPGSTTRDVGT